MQKETCSVQREKFSSRLKDCLSRNDRKNASKNKEVGNVLSCRKIATRYFCYISQHLLQMHKLILGSVRRTFLLQSLSIMWLWCVCVRANQHSTPTCSPRGTFSLYILCCVVQWLCCVSCDADGFSLELVKSLVCHAKGYLLHRFLI